MRQPRSARRNRSLAPPVIESISDTAASKRPRVENQRRPFAEPSARSNCLPHKWVAVGKWAVSGDENAVITDRIVRIRCFIRLSNPAYKTPSLRFSAKQIALILTAVGFRHNLCRPRAFLHGWCVKTECGFGERKICWRHWPAPQLTMRYALRLRLPTVPCSLRRECVGDNSAPRRMVVPASKSAQALRRIDRRLAYATFVTSDFESSHKRTCRRRSIARPPMRLSR